MLFCTPVLSIVKSARVKRQIPRTYFFVNSTQQNSITQNAATTTSTSDQTGES